MYVIPIRQLCQRVVTQDKLARMPLPRARCATLGGICAGNSAVLSSAAALGSTANGTMVRSKR